MATKPAALTSSLLSKKGAATPADAAQTKPKEPEAPPVATQEIKKGNDYHKALTVKLDKDRYMRLKQTGLLKDKSSQEIFIEALDDYLNNVEA